MGRLQAAAGPARSARAARTPWRPRPTLRHSGPVAPARASVAGRPPDARRRLARAILQSRAAAHRLSARQTLSCWPTSRARADRARSRHAANQSPSTAAPGCVAARLAPTTSGRLRRSARLASRTTGAVCGNRRANHPWIGLEGSASCPVKLTPSSLRAMADRPNAQPVGRGAQRPARASSCDRRSRSVGTASTGQEASRSCSRMLSAAAAIAAICPRDESDPSRSRTSSSSSTLLRSSAS